MYFTKPHSLAKCVYTTFVSCVNMVEMMIIKFEAYGFFALFVQILEVGGWVSRNPNVVRILKSVGKNGQSLTIVYRAS